MWEKFCDMYSLNTEKDRELRLLCELHNKDYDKICNDIERKKRIEKEGGKENDKISKSNVNSK